MYIVRSVCGEDRMIELEEALAGQEWHILGMAEIRRGYEIIEERKSGHLLCHSAATHGHRGTGFLINGQFKSYVTEFRGVNDRLALLRLAKGNMRLLIIQVHAPTADSSEEDVDLFYDTLEGLMGLKKSEEKLIVIGDFNARIGRNTENESSARGIHGVGVINERGERLLEFALSNNMKIMNSFFAGQLSEKWTWKSPLGNVHEIDFLIVEKSNNTTEELKVLKNFNFDSDHRLLIGKMKFPRRRFFIRKSQIKSTEMNKQEFVRNLEEEFITRNLSENNTIEEIYDGIVRSIGEAARRANRVNQQGQRRISNKLTEETKKLIEGRERFNRILNKTEEERRKHQDLRKEVRKRIRGECDQHNNELF